MHRVPRALAFLSGVVFLATVAAAADPAAGETKASSCRSCHGADGNSPFEGIPSLAAQPFRYIQAQIVLYREGRRPIPEMNAAVAHLSDADIADIAAYFERQKPSDPPEVMERSRSMRGRTLAEARKCDSCHLPNFAGKDRVARLAGQREDYLLKALHDFKSGARVGTDGIMPGKLYGLNEQDLEDVAYFLARVR